MATEFTSGAIGRPSISPAGSTSSSQRLPQSAARPAPPDRPGSHQSAISVSTTSSSSTGGGDGSSSSVKKLPKFLLRSNSRRDNAGASGQAAGSSSSNSGGKLMGRRRRSDTSGREKLPSTVEGHAEDDVEGVESASLSPSVATSGSRHGPGAGRDGHSRQSSASFIDFEPEEVLLSSAHRSSVGSVDDQSGSIPPKRVSRAKTLRKKTSKLFSTKDRSVSNGSAASGPTTTVWEARVSPAPSLSPSFEALPSAPRQRSGSPSSTVSSDPMIVIEPPLRGVAPPSQSMRRPSKGQQPRPRPGSAASIESAGPSSANGFYQQPGQQTGSAVRIHDIATALPNRLGGWLSNFLPSHQQLSSSPPNAVAGSSSSSSGATPIPPSLHASSPPRASPTGQQGPRSFASAARDKGALSRYFLDSDAKKPERNTEPIWLMGRQHDGWRPGEFDEPSPSMANGLPQPPTTTMTGSPQRKTSSSTLSNSTSPGRFTNLFSGSSLSLIGNPAGEDASPRRDRGKKEDVRWPAEFYDDFRTSVWCTYRSQYAAFAALPPDLLAPPATAYDADGLPTAAFLEASERHVAAEPPIQRIQSGWAWIKSGGGSDDRGLTTDSGWGCMLRTGQTLLANGLLHHHLGRGWRRPERPPGADASPQEIFDYATYVRILSWFLDDPLPFAPFSVQRMALIGKQLGKEVGEWFGPSTAAGAIRTLVSAYPYAGVAVSVAADSVIVKSDVFAASQPASAPADAGGTLGKKSAASAASKPTKWGSRPVIVLVGIRLGLDGVNPIYHDSVRDLFTFPQSLGIAGGRPSSSYYFLGYQGDSLIYLDPHHTRAAIPPKPVPSRDELLARAAAGPELDQAAEIGGEDAASPAEAPPSTPTADPFLTPVATAPPFSPSPSQARPTVALSSASAAPTQTSPSPERAGLDPLARWFATAYSSQALETFHCDKVRKMSFGQLDPSMLLGFLCKDEADWNDFRSRVANMPHAIFSISDEASSWNDDDDVGLESFSETDIDSASGADERESVSGSMTHRSSDVALDDDGEVDAELISKDDAGSPPVPESRSHSRESSTSSAPVTTSTQATPHGPLQPLGRPSAPPTARPPHARALGSEFELLDENDWRGDESEGLPDDGPVSAGPAAPGSPVPKGRQPLSAAAGRPPAATLALPLLPTTADAQASPRASLGPHRKPASSQGARLRRKAGRRSISEATARPLTEEEPGDGNDDDDNDDDDDEDDWHSHP